MSKTLDNIRALPYVAFVDDERGDGSSIIVTLKDGYEFVDNPGCGVQGFDTVRAARSGCARNAVAKSFQEERMDLSTADGSGMQHGCFIVSQATPDPLSTRYSAEPKA